MQAFLMYCSAGGVGPCKGPETKEKRAIHGHLFNNGGQTYFGSIVVTNSGGTMVIISVRAFV